jgi:lipoate-protein ligase A
MNVFDHTYSSPAANLACDEWLLDQCDQGYIGDSLRFWEATEPFIVLGYANHYRAEVNLEFCREKKIPILRRCSGGGTVVQGPGCLNYALALRIPDSGPLTHIGQTNQHILAQHRKALQPMLGQPVSIEGTSDLALLGRKISGNAQRRRKQALLFHGTLLYKADLALIGAALLLPPHMPDYRQARGHEDFLAICPAERDALVKALARIWNAKTSLPPPGQAELAPLINERYARDEWNLRL